MRKLDGILNIKEENLSNESKRSFWVVRSFGVMENSNPDLEKAQLLWNSLLRNRNNGNNQIHHYQQL